MSSDNYDDIGFFDRYYEFDTAYCQGTVPDYESSDMSQYMAIRKWGSSMENLRPGKTVKLLMQGTLTPLYL